MQKVKAALPKYGINPTLWLRRAEHTFAPIDFRGKSVLDVGSGVGWASYYAASAGAKRVVSLEPEADGSHGSMLKVATEIRSELGLEDVVEIIPRDTENADITEQFDVVMILNAINHMDEESCTILDRDNVAWEAYRKKLAPLAKWCRPGGYLVVTDCSNRNLFGDLGLKSPFAPTIEWHKHQPPQVWADLLQTLGFEAAEIDWSPHARLGILGRLLALHPALAYMVFPHFRLIMRRAS